MRMMSIASGSKGNATYIGSDNTHLLIDAGVSKKKIVEGLKRLDISLEDLDAVLITHEHSDHIASLGILERTREIPIYATEGTLMQIHQKNCVEESSGLFNYITDGSQFTIGDINITAYKTSHDATQPVCYKFSDGCAECAVVTDLGEYDDYLIDNLQNQSAIIMEANHDIRMLEAGPYPYSLKLRVAGNKGHLSNESSGRLLSRLLNDNMKYIALGHLSQKNNNKELARLTVETEIDGDHYNNYKSSDFRIDIAEQDVGTQIYIF